ELGAYRFREDAPDIILRGPQGDLDVAAVGLGGKHAHLRGAAADVDVDVRVFQQYRFERVGDLDGALERRAGRGEVVEGKGALVHRRHEAGLQSLDQRLGRRFAR